MPSVLETLTSNNAPTISIRVELRIFDEQAFRQAAYDRAIEDGLCEAEAKSFLDEEDKSLGDCGMMLVDPGASPSGSEILQSYGDD